MRKPGEKILAMLLCIVMCISLLPATAYAEKVENSTPDISTVSYEGTTSLGTLTARTLEEDEEEKGSACSILDLTVSDDVANVEYKTDQAAELVVAIYSEEGQMLGSGHTLIEEDSSSSEVQIEVEEMPEFFVTIAYLVDVEDHIPLCEQYVSRYYTEEFQAFLESTIEDYDQDRILNLDEQEDTNFLVFSEETILTEEEAGVNHITDNGDGSYTIRNADESYLSLQPGDSFAYTFSNGNLLIVVVESVTVRGTTVTVVGKEDASLEDVFTYIKIDGSSEDASLDVDTNSMDDDLIYLGEDASFSAKSYAESHHLFNEENEESGRKLTIKAIEDEESFSKSLAFQLEKELTDNYSIQAALKFSFKSTLKVYNSNEWTYIKNEQKETLELEGTLSGKYGGKIRFPAIGFSPVPGLIVELQVSFVLEFEIDANISGSVSISSGFVYDSDIGNTSIDPSPKFKGEIKVEGSVFLGIEMTPQISFLSSKVLSFSMPIKGGLEAKGTVASTEDWGDDKQHDCMFCIDGTINAKFSIKLDLSGLLGKKLFSASLYNHSYKFCDFYWSTDYQEFGLSKCPHISYKVSVTVLDAQGKPLPNVEIQGTGLSSAPTTDGDGEAVFYLPNGTYLLVFQGTGITNYEKRITVHNGKKDVLVSLAQDSNIVPGSGSCGDYLTWNLNDDGTLTISGTGDMDDYTMIDDSAFTPHAPWYDVRDSIRRIVIQKGVTRIGDAAFRNCYLVTEVTIPDSVISIGDEAFSYTPALKSITIPVSVQSIGDRVFEYNSMSEINVDANNTNYTSLDGILYSKDMTELLCYPGGKGAEIFSIPDGVTRIADEVFKTRYDTLKRITIPASVTDIGEYGFSSTGEELEEIIVNENNLNYASQDGVLFNKAMTELIRYPVGKKNESYIVPVGVMILGTTSFYSCLSLKSVTIPKSIKEIGDEAFLNCPSLADIYYAGSEEDWTKIEFGYDVWGSWQPTDPQIHYNSKESTTVTSTPEIDIEETVPNQMPGIFPEGSIVYVEEPASGSEIESTDIIEVGKQREADLSAADEETTDNASEEYEEMTAAETVGSEIIEDEPTVEVIEEAMSVSKPTANLLAAHSGTQEELGTENIAYFQGLIPGEQYLVAITRNDKLPELFKPENLLYISQCMANEEGRLAVSYIPRKNIAFASITAYGLSNTYTVTFRTDGGDAVPSYTGDQMSEYVLPAATKTGWAFLGWATEYGGAVVYRAEDTLVLQKDITLYAVWTYKEDDIQPGDNNVFSSFEELCRLAENEFSERTYAIYVGEENLILTEDILIPDYLYIIMLGKDLLVAEECTLTVAEKAMLNTESMIVDGTINNYGTIKGDFNWENGAVTSDGRLKLNGVMNNYGTVEFLAPIEEVESIHNIDNGYLFLDYAIGSEEDLMTMVNDAEKDNDAKHQYAGYIIDSFSISREIELPVKCMLYITGETVTIEKNGCVTNMAFLILYNSGCLESKGSLVNNGGIDVYDSSSIVNSGGSYTGSGWLSVQTSDPDADLFTTFLPGWDESNFDIQTEQYASLTRWILLVKEHTQTEPSNITSTSVDFNGKMHLITYIKLSDEVMADADAYVSVTFNGLTTDHSVAKLIQSLDSQGRVKVKQEMYAAMMRDEMTLQVFNGDGIAQPLTYKGTTDVTDGFVFTALEYLKGRQAESTNPKMVELARAAELYGIAVQVKFDYHTEQLTEEDIAMMEAAAGDITIPATYDEEVTGRLPAGVTNQTKTVMFESDNTLRLYYYIDDAVIGNYTFTLDGETVTAAKKEAGKYYIQQQNIASGLLSSRYTFTVSDGTDTYTIDTSALAYAYGRQENSSDQQMIDLSKLLYRYSQAADAYFA